VARRALEARGIEAASGSLTRAIREDDRELVGLLVRAGVRPKRGLRRAIVADRCAALTAMLDAGYPTAGATGTAALLLAQARGRLECVETLRRAGIDIDGSQRGVVSLVRRLVSLGDGDALSMAGRNGLSLDVVDESRRSVLIALTLRGDEEAVRALVAAHVDLDLGDRAGVTALEYALWQKNEDLAALLLDAGADPSLRDRDGWDALAVAARSGAVATVRRLLDAGLEPDGLTRQGWTALSLAVVEGHDAVVEALLAAGADPLGGLAPTPTPLEWAVRGCQPELIARLASGPSPDALARARLEIDAAECADPGARAALADLWQGMAR
jgi:ankyrin repeat protein